STYFALVTADRDVTKALKREMRFESLYVAALKRVPNRLLGRAQIRRINVAFLIEDFRVAKCYGDSGLTLDFEPDPSDHVLSHICHGVSGRRLEDLDRFDLLNTADRISHRGDQIVFRIIGKANTCPLSVRISGLRPSVLFEPRVISFAVVNF